MPKAPAKPLKSPKRKRGRPSRYTPEIADRILERLKAGDSLNSICAAEDMPDEVTVRDWVAENRSGFSAKYAAARNIGLDARADQVMARAYTNGGDVARDRLIFDAERWYLSKFAPKRYGDRVLNEHVGKDGGPIQQDINVGIDPSKLSPEQRQTLRELLLAARAKEEE
jgi:hypothetical protein